MDHDGARRLMAEGVEGRLAPGDERELAMHLVGCMECKRLYDGLQHAHPALAAIGIGQPPTKAVDMAVKRATTVLRGDADPGPLGTGPAPATGTTAPATSTAPDWQRSTGPLLADDAVEDEALAGEPSQDRPAEKAPVLPPLVEASLAEPTSREDDTRPRLPSDLPLEKPAAPPVQPVRPEPPVRSGETPEPPAIPVRPEPILPPLPVQPPPAKPPAEIAPPPPPTVHAAPPPTRVSSSPLGPPVSRVDEVEQLLDEDYHVDPRAPIGAPDEERTTGPGPWLAAIAVTIALAVLAAVLITRGQGILGGGGDLPDVEQVRSGIERVFADLKSLKTTFSIRRLSLYRLGAEGQSLTYTFANGRYTGRMIYDRAEGYRQEVTLTVNDREVDRAKIVQTDDQTRSLVGDDSIVEGRPPLGPPDGSLRPSLGFLELAVGAAMQAVITAERLEVVGRTTQDDRELYEVRATVTPNELTRADRIDVFLDANTFFPAIISRSISRVDAGVLGPPDVLTDEAISTAFGDRERITTELVELENTVRNDIILPGEYALDIPDGTQTQTRDSGFKRVSRVQLADELAFNPLFPRTLPDGYEEQLLAITAEKRGWGPGGRYPAPDGVMHASYFDGKTTIVITLRNIASGPFNLDGSPLQSGGLPITVRPYERAEKRFFYGVSPETPPHAYGFLGNVFAMVTGYASAEDLVGILASLAEAPATAPAQTGATPSPGASPTASPAATSSGAALPGEP